jgi:hypothetical protein
MDKKAIVVPAEAETVRTIVTRYLELGAVQALAVLQMRTGARLFALSKRPLTPTLIGARLRGRREESECDSRLG